MTRLNELDFAETLPAVVASICPRTIKSVGFSVPADPGKLGLLWDTHGVADRPDDVEPMETPSTVNASCIAIVPAHALSPAEAEAIISGCNCTTYESNWDNAAYALGHMLGWNNGEVLKLLLPEGARFPVRHDPKDGTIDIEFTRRVALPVLTAVFGCLPFQAVVAVELKRDDVQVFVVDPSSYYCEHMYKAMSDFMVTNFSICSKTHTGRCPYLKDTLGAFYPLKYFDGLSCKVTIPAGFIETIGEDNAEEEGFDKAKQEAWAAAYSTYLLLLREGERGNCPVGRLWRQACEKLREVRRANANVNLDPWRY